ncbi:MAG: type II toxin-antitoxin system Phd/YefM family antitoxin [Cyanobacteria bacterium P01_E01_bin.42]
MSVEIPYTEAIQNFDKIYETVIGDRQAIAIPRDGDESVSLLPTAELESLLETVYLFQSHENAKRLLESLERYRDKSNKSLTVEELCLEFGLSEEEKASA